MGVSATFVDLIFVSVFMAGVLAQCYSFKQSSKEDSLFMMLATILTLRFFPFLLVLVKFRPRHGGGARQSRVLT